MKPRVKICGLTRSADAALAAALGASHVGCVLVPGTPRCVSAAQARAVFAAAAQCTPVAVFRDAEAGAVALQARAAGSRFVQLHDCSAATALALEQEGFTVLRVHRVAADATSLPRLEPPPASIRPAVLDVGGGTGTRFPWHLLGAQAPDCTFVAGGIGPDNVRELLGHRPWGIDLSSGVEHAPGIKDRLRLERLFARLEAS